MKYLKWRKKQFLCRRRLTCATSLFSTPSGIEECAFLKDDFFLVFLVFLSPSLHVLVNPRRSRASRAIQVATSRGSTAAKREKKNILVESYQQPSDNLDNLPVDVGSLEVHSSGHFRRSVISCRARQEVKLLCVSEIGAAEVDCPHFPHLQPECQLASIK